MKRAGWIFAATLAGLLTLGLAGCQSEQGSAAGTLQPLNVTHPDEQEPAEDGAGSEELLPSPVASLELQVTALPFELESSLPLHQSCEIRVTARDASGAAIAQRLPVELWVEQHGEECLWLQGDTSVPGTERLGATTNQVVRLAGLGRAQAFELRARLLRTHHPEPTTAPWSMSAYPPAWCSLNVDPVGDAIGGALWRLRLVAHFWDPYNHEAAGGSWARWFADPQGEPPICELEEDSTQLHQGYADNGLRYHCQQIGDSLQGLWMEVRGLVRDESTPAGWRWGTLRASLADPDDLASVFRLPFQTGDRDDCLTIALQTYVVEFQPNCDGPEQQVEVLAQVTLVDGYGCPARGFDLQLWSDAGGQFTPGVVRTDGNGTAAAILTVNSGVLPNLDQPCLPPHLDCWQMGSFTVNIGATLLSVATVQSNDCSVTLTQPCPGGEN